MNLKPARAVKRCLQPLSRARLVMCRAAAESDATDADVDTLAPAVGAPDEAQSGEDSDVPVGALLKKRGASKPREQTREGQQ